MRARGVSGNEMEEWNEISCFTEGVPIRKQNMRAPDEGRLLLPIPEKFWRFYNLNRKHRVVSINGNDLLVIVSGDIVEEKKYPS